MTSDVGQLKFQKVYVQFEEKSPKIIQFGQKLVRTGCEKEIKSISVFVLRLTPFFSDLTPSCIPLTLGTM